MKKLLAALSFTSVLCSLLAGCSEDQAVDPGTNTGDAKSVDVVHGADSVKVSLGTLSTLQYKEVDVVRLGDVWTAAFPSTDPNGLAFSFVSASGFRPSDKDCADMPGPLLGNGYIEPVSGNLVWDESLGLRGCYSVRETARMEGFLPDAGMPDVTVVE